MEIREAQLRRDLMFMFRAGKNEITEEEAKKFMEQLIEEKK